MPKGMSVFFMLSVMGFERLFAPTDRRKRHQDDAESKQNGRNNRTRRPVHGGESLRARLKKAEVL